MNKLITNINGGFPFVLEDIRFEQQAVRDAFTGLLSAWGINPADSFIISGCESVLNGSNYDISAGWISLNGEILQVDAHSVAATLSGGAVHYWSVAITYDPAGNKTFQNASVNDTYQVRKGVVLNGVPSGSYMPMLAETIHNKIFENINPQFGQYQFANIIESFNFCQNDGVGGLGNDINLQVRPQSNSYFRYSIIGKQCHVNFKVDIITTQSYTTSPAYALKFKNLPITFKNNQTALFFAGCSNISDANSGSHTVSTNGNSLIFELRNPDGNIAFWNRGYQMATSPSKNYATTSDVLSLFVWGLTGSFTFELI